MTLEQLLAREGMRETIATYNLSGDAAQVDDITNTFADDCELVLMDHSIIGKPAVHAFYTQRRQVREEDARNNRPARHYLSTQRIEVTGPDTGAATTYFQLIRLGVIEQMGTYHDRFRKVGDRWLFSYRRVEMNWILPE